MLLIYLTIQGNFDHKYVRADPWDKMKYIKEETVFLKNLLPLGAVYLMDDSETVEQESTVGKAQTTQLEELVKAWDRAGKLHWPNPAWKVNGNMLYRYHSFSPHTKLFIGSLISLRRISKFSKVK